MRQWVRDIEPWQWIAALAVLLFFTGLGGYQLHAPDEPRFALVSKEMLQDGDFIVPHLQRQVYTNKPPLYLWLVALISLAAGGVSEWSTRLPSALAATGCVLLTYGLGRRLLGERTGRMGAVVLMTTLFFILRGRWASTDMTLSFFFLLAMVLLARSLQGGSTGEIHKGAARWFFVATALATMTKGPVGIVLPVGILGLTLLASGRGRDLVKFPWLSGMAIYLLLVAPWYVAYGLEAGGGAAHRIVLVQNVTRFFKAWNNRQPFYYYLHRFPLSMLPWSLFIPATVAALIRRPRDRDRSALWFLAIWFLVIFVFFSISTGKRTVYLLPAFPAAALLLGWFLDRGWDALGRSAKAWVRGTALGLAALLVAAAVAAPLFAPKYLDSRLPGLSIGVVLVLVAVSVGIAGWKSRIPVLTGALAGGVVLATLVSIVWVLPELDSYQNVRNLSARIKEIVPADAPLATEEKKRESFLFYTGLWGPQIRGVDELRAFMESQERVYCLLNEDFWDRSVRDGAVSGTVLLRAPVSDFTYALVSNEVDRAPNFPHSR